MSYLSSILGSINNPSAPRSATSSPLNQAPIARPPPHTSNLKQPQNGETSTIRTEKAKRESAAQQPSDNKAARPQSASYGGTARPATSQTGAQVNVARPAHPPASKTVASSTAAAPAKLAAPTATGPPPSKGSYKDILARAAANQKAQANIGRVTHKPVEKLSRRERLKREEEAAAAAKKNGKIAGAANGRFQGSGPSGGIAKSGNAGRVLGGPKSALMSKEKPKRQPIDLGYKGTMRAGPAPASRPAAKQRSGHSSNSRAYGSSRYTYAASDSGSDVASYDDGDNRDDVDDDDDDDDDGGGGFDELMEEEEMSLRAARKEDAEALREENEHRREKEERRKKLAALAAKRSR